MNIKPIRALKDNYIWAIVDDAQHVAIIVDPGDATPVNAFLREQQLTLAGILITHHHWDHCDGITELRSHYSVPIYGPVKEKIVGVTEKVDEGDEINFDYLALKIVAIPGHTLGHIAYYSPGILFCGDTLFAAGCGRLFEGTAEQMVASLMKIAALPDDTKIYCAHEYTFNNLRFAQLVEPNNKKITERLQQVKTLRDQNLPTLPSLLGIEKETNPFFRCDSAELIANVEKYAGQKISNPVDVFSRLRHWKDTF